MRKAALIFITAVSCIVGGFESNAGVADKILLYVPNRIVDFSDIITGSLSFGTAAGLDIRLTRGMDFGAGTGITARAIKGYNQQYGGAIDNYWSASFMCLSGEDTERSIASRWVKEYIYHSSGMPLPSEPIYDMYTGARDYWEIGVAVDALVGVSFEIHPVEIADFITGFFFIDIKGDDTAVEDYDNK